MNRKAIHSARATPALNISSGQNDHLKYSAANNYRRLNGRKLI